MNTNKESSSKDKVTKVEYDKGKIFHASSKWPNEAISNHQPHAKAKIKQLARQVSHTMPRLKSTTSTPKEVNNTKPPRCARSKITPRALKSVDNSSPQSVKDVQKKERGKLPKIH